MITLNTHSEKDNLLTNNNGMLSVSDFTEIEFHNKLKLNTCLTDINTTSNGDLIRAYYIGLANGFMDHIRIDLNSKINGVTTNNISSLFKLIAINFAYKLNETTISEFNVGLFVDEVMNIYNIRLAPLFVGNTPYKTHAETHHHISKIYNSYSADDILMLDNNNSTFITGVNTINKLID